MKISKEKLQKIIFRLVQNSDPISVIGFGSFVRGNMRKDSDLDLLVIEEKLLNPRKEMVRLRRLLKDEEIILDILPVDFKTYSDWKDVKGNIFYNINKEGKILYEK
ncbi:MAG: nucleotidyltransferase domain-containing protein [Candidatus Margulisiibacteriota bacterium]|jgi:predicted nucleotidyltransferase